MRTILGMALGAFTALSACQSENSPTTSPSSYRTYEGLPCRFNGAELTGINTAATLGSKEKKCCPECNPYEGKEGESINAAVGRPVYAIADMELIFASDRTAQQWTNHAGNGRTIEGTLARPYDDLKFIFRDTLGNEIIYYHLQSNNPLVPGFGKGRCTNPLEFNTELWKRRPENCGGIAIRRVKKGDIIGFVGSTGGNYNQRWGRVSGEHISLGIIVSSRDPRFEGQSGMVVPSQNFIWENIPTDDPLKYLLPL